MDVCEVLKDNEIVGLFLVRNERALAETSRKYGALFKSVAENILGNRSDAEECENDVYLRLWNAIPPARPQNLGAYGAKTARNLALDALAKRGAEKRGGSVIFEELDDSLPDRSGREADENELGALIDSFLRKLEKRERVTFVLRYFYGEPLEKIAEKTACRVPAVKSQLFRTRKKLKAFLEKEGVSV